MAREALSARLDGEREPVPAVRVDEHLETCRPCCAWYILADEQARQVRRVGLGVGPGPDSAAAIVAAAGLMPSGRSTPLQRWLLWARTHWARTGLVTVGAIQTALAAVQVAGVSFGMMPGEHHMAAMSGAHLFNESTAWSGALGVAMIVAGIWPIAAAGLCAVLGIFGLVLGGYVIVDASAGQVTVGRMLSHLPVLAGLLLAVVVFRRERSDQMPPTSAAVATSEADGKIELPGTARRGRRRGHLWPTDGTAA